MRAALLSGVQSGTLFSRERNKSTKQSFQKRAQGERRLQKLASQSGKRTLFYLSLPKKFLDPHFFRYIFIPSWTLQYTYFEYFLLYLETKQSQKYHGKDFSIEEKECG